MEQQMTESSIHMPWYKFHISMTIKSIYSFFVALIPVISIYQFPIVNKGISTVIVFFFAPYAFLYAMKNALAVKPLFLYCFFTVWIIYKSRGDLNNRLVYLLALVHVLGVVNGAADYEIMLETIKKVSYLCAWLVIFQTLVFYLFGIRFSYISADFVLENHRQQILSQSTGSGLYRPCAFFSEPAHYATYCSLGILLFLFSEETKKVELKKAIITAFGVLCTTSGIGLVLVVCIFGWYVLFSEVKKGKKIQQIILWLIVGSIAFFLLINVPFIKHTYQRFINNNTTASGNAIIGRTLFYQSTVGSLSKKNMIVGLGSTSIPDHVYMTGYMKMVYCYGLIGYVLLIISLLVLSIWSHNRKIICICIIYFGLSFFSDNIGFLSMMFYFTIEAASMHNYQIKRSNR